MLVQRQLPIYTYFYRQTMTKKLIWQRQITNLKFRHPKIMRSAKVKVKKACLHYWIQVLCRVPEALGKGYIALGKAFAECGTRQSTHGKKLIGKALFAECILSGTRQRLCRVPRKHSAKKSDRHGAGSVDGHFAECQPCRHSAKIFLIFF